ncbi:MAG TPA: fructosamine kinase family protein, partial [Rugosimonospora sp.]|nr:fructosamine kinase family protein [Rugosimonospora sp.]
CATRSTRGTCRRRSPPAWSGSSRACPTCAARSPARPLLHGDAQQHNFLSSPSGAVLIDAAPYFGHPEMDLALVDVFQPVPAGVFRAYREVRPIDPDLEHRRELWRLPAYLAVVAVAGTYLDRLARAIAHCQGR